MRNFDGSRRYTARAALRRQIRLQGRRVDWLAEQLGVSKSFLSNVIAGRRSISEADARVLVALVGGDFRVLFELPRGTKTLPPSTKVEAG